MKYENLFKIHIPETCHENWDKMTPNELGSFCKVCAKTVVDFSGKTDEQIQRYLLENIDKKVCGRFKLTQLEETPKLKIEKPKFEFPGFLIPVITPFRVCAMSLMIFASAALMSCGNSGSGGGDDERLAGTVVVVDSVNTPIFDDKTMGGVNYKSAADTTCNIKQTGKDSTMLGKIESIQTDTLKTDTTEIMIKGEVEPRIKMGLLEKVEPEEKEYLKGDVKAEKTEY